MELIFTLNAFYFRIENRVKNKERSNEGLNKAKIKKKSKIIYKF